MIVICRFATKKFKREGINILTRHHVERVEAVSTVSLDSIIQDAEDRYRTGCLSGSRVKVRLISTVLYVPLISSPHTVPFGLLVWSTGLAPNPLIASITEAEKHPKTNRYACCGLIVFLT